MPKTSMQDSVNFAAEFKALAERVDPKTKNRIFDQYFLEFCGDCTDSGIGDWHPFGGPAELFLAEFTEIATRAGIALGSPSSVKPFNYFLDCIYNEFVARRSRFAIQIPNRANWFGEIRHACEAATTFWLW